MLPEMCLVQCRLDLFDVACEDVCYDSLSVHDFARCRYCVPDTCEVHGLVQSNDSLYHANADLRGVARHKESAWIRAPSGTGWSVAMDPSESGAAQRAQRDRGGAEASVCARTNTPARSPDVLSATQKCATATSQRRRMHIRLRLYKHK